MKQYLLFACLLALSVISFGQITKGDKLFGGNLGIYFSNSGGSGSNSQSNSNLQPFFDFAYKQNRTVGFAINFAYSQTKSNNGDNKVSSISFLPEIHFTQYHPLKNRFGWHLQEQVGVGVFSNKNKSASGETSYRGTSAYGGITPGINYIAGQNQNWLLKASVGGLQGNYSKVKGGDDSFALSFNMFSYYQFGFAYVFKK